MKLRHLLSLCTLCAGTSAFAVPVLDQNQPAETWGWAYVGIFNESHQSFQQSADNISGAGIHLNSMWGAGGSATFTIGVFSANPYASPGSLLASGTATGGAGDWVDAFWTPIQVAPATTLYLSISTQTAGVFVAGHAGDVYALGSAGYQGSDQPAYDLTFRTYAEASVADGSHTLALTTLSLLGLAALRRRFAPAHG